jgi:hypothetical protein
VKFASFKNTATTSNIFKSGEGKKQFILFLTRFGHLAGFFSPSNTPLITSVHLETSTVFYVIFFSIKLFAHTQKNERNDLG